MTYQSMLLFLSGMVAYLNAMLVQPASTLQTNIGLRTDIFFFDLHSPINYLSVFCIFLLFILFCANNFICNLFGILYPLMYGIMLINNPNNEYLMQLNKYWVLFGVMNLLDGFFSFILGHIPGYYYLKLIFIFCLIRNDFYWSNYCYDMIHSYYTQFGPTIDSYIVNIVRFKKNEAISVVPDLFKTD